MEKIDWGKRASAGYLASTIDPMDRRGRKNCYIDLLHKRALEEVLRLRGDETVLDFGCGSGRIARWIAPQVKRVIGLDSTPEMLRLAEQACRAESNIELILYDGTDLPPLPTVDLILSVWVLQYMQKEAIQRTLSVFGRVLKPGGRLCLIEQVSDNTRMERPALKDYLDAFRESGFDCLQNYPIRKGRWWLLYLIRYGLIPETRFPQISSIELRRWRKKSEMICYYDDFLFVARAGIVRVEEDDSNQT